MFSKAQIRYSLKFKGNSSEIYICFRRFRIRVTFHRENSEPIVLGALWKFESHIFIRRIKLCFLRFLFGFAPSVKPKTVFVGFTFSIDSPISFPPIFSTFSLVWVSACILIIYWILLFFLFFSKLVLKCCNKLLPRAEFYDFLPRRMIRR